VFQIAKISQEELLKRGDPQEFLKLEISTLLIRMIYPAVLSHFIGNFSVEETKKHLFNIGKNSADKMLAHYHPKAKDIKKVIKSITKLWSGKFKIKEYKKENVFTLTTKQCPLCYEMPEISIEGLHNCYPLASFIDGYLNGYALIPNEKLNYKSTKTRITKSLGAGDPYCELLIQVEK